MLGHGQVQQENVGLELPRQFHRLGAVRGLTQHLQIRLCFQQPAQTIPEYRMVVSYHNANGL
jgi:hypothetical protein